MMKIILLIISITILGYIFNRIIYWISQFIYEWCKVVFSGDFWFYKGTTIKTFIENAKYHPNELEYSYSKKQWDRKYNDGYDCCYKVRWVPILNIIIPTCLFIARLFAFLCVILALISFGISKFIYFIFGKYVYKFACKCYHSLCNLLVKIKVVYAINIIYDLYKNLIDKILNIRIS